MRMAYTCAKKGAIVNSLFISICLLFLACGCGDYATNSEIDALQSEIDALETQVEDLEAVFVSDVIINTDARTKKGAYVKFGGTIDVDPKNTISAVKGKISDTILFYFLRAAQDSKSTEDYLKNINCR